MIDFKISAFYRKSHFISTIYGMDLHNDIGLWLTEKYFTDCQ